MLGSESIDQARKWVFDRAVPLDQQFSALEQVHQMTTEHPLTEWSRTLDASLSTSQPESQLATMLLAVNYELLGYPPEQAWMLARRGESAAPGHLDG